MDQEREEVFVENMTHEEKSSSFLPDELHGALSPWKTAFPDRQPMGYWDVFSKRCAKIAENSNGVISEETAKDVWLSILGEYEAYLQMGMWLPEGILEEHRIVAKSLGWIEE